MQAIINLATGEILYWEEGLSLDADGARGGEGLNAWHDSGTTLATAMLLELPQDRPDDFSGRGYRYTQQGNVERTEGGSDAHNLKLKAARDEAWERIKAHRERLSDFGGYQVGGKWFHSDLKSKIQQVRLASKAEAVQAQGGNMNAPLPGPSGGPLLWKTMGGAFIPMSATLALQVAAAAEAMEMALFARAEQHRAGMLAASDPLAYDFSGGWPETFKPAAA